MKLVGNLIVALELEALAEGLVLAQKSGLDLNTVMEVVKVADFRSPLIVSNGQNILKRDFSTSFALKLMLKMRASLKNLVKACRHPFRPSVLLKRISNWPLPLASEKRMPPL